MFKTGFSVNNINLYLCGQVENTKWILCNPKIGSKCAYLRFIMYNYYKLVQIYLNWIAMNILRIITLVDMFNLLHLKYYPELSFDIKTIVIIYTINPILLIKCITLMKHVMSNIEIFDWTLKMTYKESFPFCQVFLFKLCFRNRN